MTFERIDGLTANWRRLRRMHISPELMANIIGCGVNHAFRAVEPVQDLRIIWVEPEINQGKVELTVESASFDPVPPWLEPPIWTPSYTKVDDGR